MSAPGISGERSATAWWSYRSGASDHDVVVSTPAASPDLWAEYLARAERTYAARGVAGVLDLDRVRDGRSTSLFVVGLGPDGRPAGGLRVQGPYLRPDQAHALAEWHRAPGRSSVRAMIADRLRFGVVEVKAAWVARELPRRRELVACLARAPLHAATILGARFALATAAAHTLPMWTATGAVPARGLDAVEYPDDRYSTTLLWWDRWALPDTVTEAQRRALDLETAALLAPTATAA